LGFEKQKLKFRKLKSSFERNSFSVGWGDYFKSKSTVEIELGSKNISHTYSLAAFHGFTPKI
jgi:hypothetical protein